MQHFIVSADLKQDTVSIYDKKVLHQMNRVLRLKVGGEIILMDGCGTKALGKIIELHKKAAIFKIQSTKKEAESKRKVKLALALAKKASTFELIVQKATEIGASDIIPLVTERCQVREIKKLMRLHAIIKEASEQCERSYLPRLHETHILNDLQGCLLVGEARMKAKSLSHINMKDDITLVIGPEGGFSDNELYEIEKRGAQFFSLGDNILRMETAAIAALSIVQFGWKHS